MTPQQCIEALCLRCGICCNGVLFGDVQIPNQVQAQRLRAAGLPVRSKPLGKSCCSFLPQPCPALGPDNVCTVYAQRPARCREFECALFKRVVSGTLTLSQATRVVKDTLAQANRVRQDLRWLGETHEAWPLARRFRCLKRRFPRQEITEESARVFAELSLNVHDLNMTLRLQFYPEAGVDKP